MANTIPPPFEPRMEILPSAQRILWPELKAIPKEFTLYGGTALALHLGHRQSIDFDFFGSKDFDPSDLLSRTDFLVDAEILRLERNTLDISIDRDGGTVKLSFFGVPSLPRLRPTVICPDNGLKIASLLDIAGTKVKTVQERAEAKDYIDIAALLTDGRINLGMALTAGSAIYGRHFTPQVTLKALAYFDDGNLTGLPSEVRATLIKAVRETDPLRLPKLASAKVPVQPMRNRKGGVER